MNCIICGKEMPEYCIKQGKKTCCRNCQCRTPEARQKRSEIATNLWKKESYKTSHKDSMDKVRASEEYHQKLSNSISRATSTVEYRQKRSNIAKEIWQRDDYQQKISEARKNKWKDTDFAERVLASREKLLENPEFRKKLSDTQKVAQSKQSTNKKRSNTLQKIWSNDTKRVDILQKRHSTMKKNHSFNSSKPEQYIKDVLKRNFNNVHPQYKCDRYPFNCDFYIEDLDLFIELNFHWTHGFMPYNENDQRCKEQLAKWKEKAKTSKFYKRAIRTWTILDVEKLETLKSYKLNYKIFYTWNDFETWLQKYTKKLIA